MTAIRASRRQPPVNDAEPSAGGDGDKLVRAITHQVLIAIGTMAILAVLYFLATSQAVSMIDRKGMDAERERARMAVAQTIVLDAEAVQAIETTYQLDNARLVLPDRVGPNEISQPTGRADGSVLAWTPRRLGTQTLQTIGPMRIAAAILLLSAILFVLYRLQALARHLDRRLAAARTQALQDSLTGLASRRAFDEALETQLQLLHSEGAGTALFLLDLDGFKDVNDRLGHLAGDELLREMARRIKAYARPTDLVARLGGDEFAIIRTTDLDCKALEEFATDLVHLLSAPCAIDRRVAEVTVSIGIARLPEHARSTEELVSAADAALYRAKALRGGHFEFANTRPYPMTTAERPAA